MRQPVLAACLLLSWAALAQAAPVTPTPPEYLVELGENTLPGVIGRDPGSYTSSGGRTTGSVAGAPVALVSAASNSVAGDFSVAGSSTSAAARLFYSVAVNGPADGVLVPLFAATRLHADSTTPGSFTTRASASLGISNTTGAFQLLLNTDFNSPLPGTDFTGTLAFTQRSGSLSQIALQAVTTANGGGRSAASVDPFFFIDPEFLAANPGYSVSVSAGVVNAVPAPPALSLLATGLVPLVLGRLRRRRVSP